MHLLGLVSVSDKGVDVRIDVLHVVCVRLPIVVVDKVSARSIQSNNILAKTAFFRKNSHPDGRKMTACTVTIVRRVIAAKINAASFHTR